MSSQTMLRAPWLQREDLQGLAQALGPEAMRWVGGAVRDSLLGLAIKDLDAATLLHPQEVIERCAAHGIRTVPTGLDHGTVTALCAGGPVEITTLRRDVATDGRHATISFAQEWHEDAARRDFTINALYAHPVSGAVSDYFGGLEDLAARRVRFIGVAAQRIAEDHLRILRYFRFQARFGSVPADAQAEEACAQMAATLKGLSRERIGMEVMNLLGLARPGATLARMGELGVLGVVLPEADLARMAGLEEWEAAHGIAADAMRRLAAALPADGALAERVAARFRLSRVQRERLAKAVVPSPADSTARAMAYWLGREVALDRLAIAGRDPTDLAGWEAPVFGLKGGEIMARGLGQGREIARILQAVEQAWVAEGFPPPARVEAILAQVTTP